MKYPTKQDIDIAFETWEPIEVDFQEECIVCWYKEYWWILITKIPEMVSLCESCSEMFNDEKEYEWKEWFWTCYEIWNWFITSQYYEQETE